MKNEIITEFVKFKMLDSTSVEHLLLKAEILNEFQIRQDGYIDSELVKKSDENSWCLIYHYESLEKVKVIGEKMRCSKVFDEFIPLIEPGSLEITFCQQFKKW
jgi:hypothetical protein